MDPLMSHPVPTTSPFILSVTAQVLGQRRPIFRDVRIPIPPDAPDPSGRLTLRDLIAVVVESEVAAAEARAEHMQITRVLSPQAIEDGAARGRIVMGGDDQRPAAPIDTDAAVATALVAFEDGLYFVFIGGEQKHQLDETVFVGGETALLFVRLVALVGG
jgi:hypothetical protein